MLSRKALPCSSACDFGIFVVTIVIAANTENEINAISINSTNCVNIDIVVSSLMECRKFVIYFYCFFFVKVKNRSFYENFR